MDHPIQYFYEENDPTLGNNQYYDQRREQHNDEHRHAELENYDTRYNGQGKSYGRNADYVDHRRAPDQREMMSRNHQEVDNSQHDHGAEELSQNLNVDMETDRSQKVAETTSPVKKTTPAKPNLDYKTELEIHDYNISVNSQIKQLLMQKKKFDMEIYDLKNRLRQSEERYERQAGELLQCKEMYEREKLALRIELEKRSEIKEKQNALQENTDGLLKQVEEIHKIWPNMQKSFELMLANLAKQNQSLKENIVTYRTEIESCKKLLKDSEEKESVYKGKITELAQATNDYSTEVMNLNQKYDSLHDDYEKVISAYEDCRAAMSNQELKINELTAKLSVSDYEINEISEKYHDLSGNHDKHLTTYEELQNEHDALLSKYNKLTEIVEIQKSTECVVSTLKQELQSAESRLREKSLENQKQAERDQNVIKEMAKHLDLYKAECEQKIKEEQSFAEKKNIELQQQVEALRTRYDALERDKEDTEKDLDEYTKKHKEFEAIVSEQRRTINNISKRLEDKSSENIKLLSEMMTFRSTVKSLEQAKSYYMLQNQNKKKEIEMLRSAGKKRQLKPEGSTQGSHAGYSAPLNNARYDSDVESDSSGNKKVAQFFYDKNNVKQLRLITKRKLRMQEEAAAAQKRASQTNTMDSSSSSGGAGNSDGHTQKEIVNGGVPASQALSCREDEDLDDGLD